MKPKLILSLAFVVIVAAACTSAPPRPAQVQGDDFAYARDHARWMIGEKMVEHDIVGLSIALVDDQRIVWAEGFGFADEQDDIPASAETIYRVGSITKLFTATAVMQLAEQGRLDLDLPVQQYLPQFTMRSRGGDASPMTLRSLLTHHSGLPSDLINGMWGDETARYTDVVAMLRDEYVAFAPYTVAAYSNLGFSILGHVVEAVSGTPYAEYVERNILQPTGMKNAYVAANLRDDALSSKGYYDQEETATPSLRDVPAGSLNSSVLDLAHFAKMTFAGGKGYGARVLQPTTLTEMQRFQDGDAIFDVSRSVGLAWALDDRFGEAAGVIARHDGGTPLFHSEFVTLPKHKLAVVVLANSNTGAGVVSEIAEETLKRALESKAGITVEEPPQLEQQLPVVAADLERLPGAWSSPSGLVHIRRRDDRLDLLVDDQRLDLVRREDGYYHLQYKLFGLLPVALGGLQRAGFAYQRIAGRDFITMFMDGKPRTVIAEKATTQPLPPGWKDRLGRYQSINGRGGIVVNEAELNHRDGLLLLTVDATATPGEQEELTIVLNPVTNSEAVVHGLGRGKGDTVQFREQDGNLLMSYSGFVLRRSE